MSDNEKYCALLRELGELIQQKNTYIDTREYIIESLRRKIETLENQITELQEIHQLRKE